MQAHVQIQFVRATRWPAAALEIPIHLDAVLLIDNMKRRSIIRGCAKDCPRVSGVPVEQRRMGAVLPDIGLRILIRCIWHFLTQSGECQQPADKTPHWYDPILPESREANQIMADCFDKQLEATTSSQIIWNKASLVRVTNRFTLAAINLRRCRV